MLLDCFIPWHQTLFVQTIRPSPGQQRVEDGLRGEEERLVGLRLPCFTVGSTVALWKGAIPPLPGLEVALGGSGICKLFAC